jgi:DNA-binding NarL/FixJ family response regulator
MKRSHLSDLPLAGAGGRMAPAKARILVLDEHDFVRRSLCAMINAERDMMVCGSATLSGFEAARLGALRPDVVLIDVSGSQRAGLALVCSIRKVDANVRIVALALSERSVHARPVLSAGATDFVFKGALADRVLAALRRAHALPRRPSARPPAADRGGRAAGKPPMDRPQFDEVERSIMALVGAGVPTATIAVRLRMPFRAVQTCLRVIKSKVNAANAVALVRYCVDAHRGGRRMAHC